MRKKGQIFIVASIIIILIISSIAIYGTRIYNQNNKKDIISLKKEISYESSSVIDYGIANNEDKLKDFLSNISSEYLSKDENIELIFFFGNSSELNVLNLGKVPVKINISGTEKEINNVNRSANLNIGGSGLRVVIDLESASIRDSIVTFNLAGSETEINFKLNETNYKVNLLKNKNFYFLIKREEGENVDVLLE